MDWYCKKIQEKVNKGKELDLFDYIYLKYGYSPDLSTEREEEVVSEWREYNERIRKK